MRLRISPKGAFGLATVLGLPTVLYAQLSHDVRQPIARVGDQPIFEEDLLPSIGAQLLLLKNQEYELKMGALTNLVNQRLLEVEANRKGLSVEDFLEQTVDRNLPPWHTSGLEGYYLARKHQLNKPLATVRPQLERTYLEARRQHARQEYIDQLRQNAGISILLSRPRADVPVDPSRLLGDPEAPVTIVEFADFECPYCQSVLPVLKEIMHEYKGKVRLGFRDFPLSSIHPRSEQAAESARCAGEQGKFWEYHDLLYANQGRLDPNILREHARVAGMDVERFSACLVSGRFRGLVEDDRRLGAANGVKGTPTFYINGEVLTGSAPTASFQKIIESAIADAASRETAAR